MDQFPNEIVIKIFHYLSTYDIIQFCNVYKSYSCFLKERSIISKTDFSHRYEVHQFQLLKFITDNLAFNLIKILNINCLYWIPGQDLRRLLKKLENLEELYALDTKLGMEDKDILEYLKLKKIAVSVEDNEFDHSSIVASKQLKMLKSLCLKIILKKDMLHGMYLFFREVKQLEELWIYDDDVSIFRIDYGQLAVALKNLKKFVIKSETVLPYYDFRYMELFKVFECKRRESVTEVIYEKILMKPEATTQSIFEPKDSDIEKSWEILESLHKDVPCGPKESKLIYLKENIKNIYFEDLNFCHTVILCNTKYIHAALQILSSKNSTTLQKLSFRSCLFLNSQQMPSKEEQVLGFKRTRQGVHINSTHPFRSTAENLKNLRELEISTCSRCNGVGVISAYSSIGVFEKLVKLNLEIPLLLDGSFLREVFMNCKLLQFVSLICTAQNEKFMVNLYQNLKYATSLKHFRLYHKQIIIDKLLNGFGEIGTKRLLRMFLHCSDLRCSGKSNIIEPFSVFMESHQQLIFFFLVISNNTAKQNSQIQNTLNSFKKGNPAKVFYVKKDIFSFSGVFPIPTAHHDMIFNRTNVSVVSLNNF